MKTLETLIKLQKSLVDEQRQMLARLQEALEMIQQRIAALEIEKTREQLAAQQPEARATYGAFLQGAAKRGQALELQRRATECEVEAARLKLSELFEAQKRYEIADEARLAAEAKEESRRERIQLDEIGGIMHERGRSADKREK